MSVTLDIETEARIRRFIETGAYPDADSVVRDALRLLKEQEQRREWLRDELQSAVQQAERGELIDFTPNRSEEMKQRAVESAQQGKPIRDAVKP